MSSPTDFTIQITNYMSAEEFDRLKEEKSDDWMQGMYETLIRLHMEGWLHAEEEVQ